MATVLIAAMGLNRVIGREGDLPWHQPADLAHFKKLTLHHPVVMGRKTFESFDGSLPGRLNIVVTRQKGYRAPGVEVASSLEEAIRIGERKSPGMDVFVAGGGEIYSQALTRADRVELTLMHGAPEGDTRFPELPAGIFRVTACRFRPADESHALGMSFLTMERGSLSANGVQASV